MSSAGRWEDSAAFSTIPLAFICECVIILPYNNKPSLRDLCEFRWKDFGLHVPAVKNRATGKSMGEHCEEMAKQWKIARADQDRIALQSHQRAVTAMRTR